MNRASGHLCGFVRTLSNVEHWENWGKILHFFIQENTAQKVVVNFLKIIRTNYEIHSLLSAHFVEVVHSELLCKLS